MPEPAELASPIVRFRRKLVITIGVCATAVVFLWFTLVDSAIGRRLDDAVSRGRVVASVWDRTLDLHSLDLITRTTLAIGLLVIVAIAVVRRRALVGVVAAGAVIGATLTTEVLKRTILHRPVTAGEVGILASNSFPSGHATISTAIVLAVLMVVPRHWRTTTALLGAVWLTVQTTGVVVCGWHRTSDSIAGLAVGLAWSSTAILALVAAGRVVPASDVAESKWSRIAFPIAGLPVLITIAAIAIADTGAVSTPDRLVFLGAVTVIDALAVVTVWWWCRLVVTVDLDQVNGSTTPEDDHRRRWATQR